MKRAEERKSLHHVRLMEEQEWAYLTLTTGHLSALEASKRTIAPREQGGLGYYLSPQQLRGLSTGYRERMQDALEASPAERVQQELADLDAQYRAAARLADPVDRERTEQSGEVAMRDERIILAALTTLRQIGERRAKLLGLDAATQAHVTVEHVDPTDAAIKALAKEFDKR